MTRPDTNEVYQWILERIEPLREDLGIKTIIQGDFTSLPAPDQVSDWCNILLIKPKTNRITPSDVYTLYRIDYFFEIFYIRKFSQDEPINASLVEDTESILEALFTIEDDQERFSDDGLILEALPTDVDYNSDVEGLLRALDLDVTASKIDYQLKAEK